MLTGLSMPRLSRRHLTEEKMVSGRSRDQNKCGKRGRERGACSTSKPEGIWLLCGLCDRLFADGQGGSGDICRCGHSGKRKRESPMKSERDELKYHGLTQPDGGVPLSLFPLPVLPRRIYGSFTILRYASYPIYRAGPNIPSQIRNILSAYLSQIPTIPCFLPFPVDTSPSVSEHPSCINFGEIVVCGVSNASMKLGQQQLVSLPFDNFIIASNGVFTIKLFARHSIVL